jgi:BirA family biotin operon repressor/biotin-[acetyl-CoA-carboxylase] ligase
LDIGIFSVRHHALLDSSNEEARRLADQGCAHGTVIWADEQTAGHGRYDRPWLSPPGNLLVSVVLRPAIPITRVAELGFVAAVMVADCVAELLPPGPAVTLKWPNDVLVDDAKISGVLPEAGGSDAAPWVVLGVGLNLAHAPTGVPYPATSLGAHGAAVTSEAALRAFLGHLERWLARWDNEGFGAVREAWLARAPRVGTEVTVTKGQEAEPARGVFHGLDADGALLLGVADGVRRISAGDVKFGPA